MGCYRVVFLDKSDSWDRFVAEQGGDVQQSFAWGKLQEKVEGRGRVYRLAVVRNEDISLGSRHVEKKCFSHGTMGDDENAISEGQICVAMLLVRHQLPFGMSYLYCPRGPVFGTVDGDDSVSFRQNLWHVLFAEIKKLSVKEKALFLRVEPGDFYTAPDSVASVSLRTQEPIHLSPSSKKCKFATKTYWKEMLGSAMSALQLKRADCSRKHVFQSVHPWAGVTEFKLKFGGEIFRHDSACDYVFRPMLYLAMRCARRGQRIIKKFSIREARFASAEAKPPLRSLRARAVRSHETLRARSELQSTTGVKPVGECYSPHKATQHLYKSVGHQVDTPCVSAESFIDDFWRKNGFRSAFHSYQPEWTNMIDLSFPEEKILAQMKQKGRYNIGLAEKNGVKIITVFASKNRSHSTKQQAVTSSHNVADHHAFSLQEGVASFYRILQETTLRDGFRGHGQQFYQNFLETLGQNGAERLYLAEFEGEIIAGIIVTFFGKTARYFYGASSNQHRNMMAPYLLQWRAIQDARKEGYQWYDFFGISPMLTKWPLLFQKTV